MKVIFMPNNTSSLATIHIKELRKIGVNAVGYNLAPKYFSSTDIVKSLPSNGIINKSLFFIKFFYDLLTSDVIHWLYGGKSVPTKALLLLIRFLPKKKFVEYCGSDIRSLEMMCRDIDGYEVNNFSQTFIDNMGVLENSLATQKRYKTAGFTAMVSYPELIEYVNLDINPKFKIIARSVDLKSLTQISKTKKSKNVLPMLIHGPSNPEVKGTSYIIEAFDRLKAEGKIDYKLLQNMKHDEVLDTINDADIIVDQIVAGDYGVFAIEGMAMSKPVVCFIRPKVLSNYKKDFEDFPVINANIHNIYDVLNSYVTDKKNELERIGEASFNFASKYHDSKKNAQHLKDIYEGLK